MKTFGRMDRQIGPAKHALETAHQVVMADQSKCSIFAKAQTDLLDYHVADGPCTKPTHCNAWAYAQALNSRGEKSLAERRVEAETNRVDRAPSLAPARALNSI